MLYDEETQEGWKGVISDGMYVLFFREHDCEDDEIPMAIIYHSIEMTDASIICRFKATNTNYGRLYEILNNTSWDTICETNILQAKMDEI